MYYFFTNTQIENLEKDAMFISDDFEHGSLCFELSGNVKRLVQKSMPSTGAVYEYYNASTNNPIQISKNNFVVLLNKQAQ